MTTIAVVLDELKGEPTSVVPILKYLTVTKGKGLAPEETRHLVARTLNLARSNQPYSKWCGTVMIKALALNYELLASDGAAMLDVLIQNLHAWNASHDIKVLTATVDSINFVCDQIRGKDTLVRELLTPRLAPKGAPSIIGGYLDQLEYAPAVVVPSLTKILVHHPTVFRAYGNKYYAALVAMVALPNFDGFPESLRQSVFGAIATLPVIENVSPEAHWRARVGAIIAEIVRVLRVYGDLLHFEDDGDLNKLLSGLEAAPAAVDGKSVDPIFADLAIDFNAPSSILLLSTRLKSLTELLGAYLTQGSKLTVEVPLGKALGVIEAMVLISPRFHKFKFDVRDANIQHLITLSTELNHTHAIALLKRLVPVYSGSLLPHFSSIVATLETVVPIHNKRVDTVAVVRRQRFFGDLLVVVADLLALATSVSDPSSLLRFLDVAVALVEPRMAPSPASTNAANSGAKGAGKKAKRSKKASSVPLADLLTNANLLVDTIPEPVLAAARRFFTTVVTSVPALPPTYHYKMMRYIILEAVHAKYYTLHRQVPQELRQLLIDAIVYPGYEKVSILPIVASILADDPLVSVFTHPRLPPLPKFIDLSAHQTADLGVEDESDSEDDEELGAAKRDADADADAPAPKKRKVDDVAVPQPTSVTPVVEEAVVETIAEQPIAEPVALVETVPVPVAETVPAAPAAPSTAALASAPAADSDDSDFEMPQLDAGDSDDE
ncbi:hypothetical protein DIURU_001108 [Diutina rugosa]|uniref:Pre-rRNA-processing protein RIX1 n=1 Tax=Diutina rugosa TaxID=5481 RepID=A0A642UVP6_DIURU|nr:uncharacterized protein DIURU_001108 [Diutina rugosa]KAA8906370.1 hypothetical protein DIURU_001108 [Diutina rugosa]